MLPYDTTKPYVPKILDLIRTTWHTNWCAVHDGIYPIVELKHCYPYISHTDGVGSKFRYHWSQRTFKSAAIDAFAMNFNDLIMAGATPFELQNHICLPEDDDEAIFEIIETLVELSKKYDIVMSGGETSIYGLDISITMHGFVRSPFKNDKRNCYQLGDLLVGLPSSGLHSNGFTLVHKKLGGFREEYVKPTRIYSEVATIYNLINAANHITGGAYTKLKPYIPKDCDLIFDFATKSEVPPQIFQDLYNTGISSEEMYKTFNCGYGFILSVPEESLEYVLKTIDDAQVIGHVVKGSGNVYIESAFDSKIVKF